MIFLKLGGSLITEKSRPRTPRLDTIERLAGEIADAVHAKPGLPLLIGHGSGSFGHHEAARFGTNRGAVSADDWLGFAIVADAARELHRLVIGALLEHGLPVVSFPPSAMLFTQEGGIVSYNTEPIERALDEGLIPVVHGDAVLDRARGASIVSTEQVFNALAGRLSPQRVLLAGLEPGVLTPDGEVLDIVRAADVGGLDFESAAGEDVTGGMRSKVDEALALVSRHPDLELLIFTPLPEGCLARVLLGERAGTRICA